ncbi:MAG: hypothetical protein ACKO1X_02025 [Acidimicrobiales bacterium]
MNEAMQTVTAAVEERERALK